MRISDWSSDVCSSDLHNLPDRYVSEGRGAELYLCNCGGGRSYAAHHIRLCDAHPQAGKLPQGGDMDVLADRHDCCGVCGCCDLRRCRLADRHREFRSEEPTSVLQSLMRMSYAVL